MMNKITSGIFVLILAFCTNLHAEIAIAILPFELNDITSLPNTQAELARTASMKPLLEQAMIQLGEYKIISIPAGEYKAENAGLGYLFRFHDIATKLGEKVGADWVVVSQHSKPSFLYSYLIAHVINVKTGRMAARFDVELKGNHQKVTRRGIRRLSREINKMLGSRKDGEILLKNAQ
jgi:hypothetical protein